MDEQKRKRRRGGHELPDEIQDRPEQNEGYDEAVRGGGPEPEPPEEEGLPLPVDERDSRSADVDERAARSAAAEE